VTVGHRGLRAPGQVLELPNAHVRARDSLAELRPNSWKRYAPALNSRTATRIGVALGLAYLVRRLFPPAPRLKDHAYARLSPAQRLDLYVPRGRGPFPVIVHVHGGGWRTGDKADPRALIGISTLIRKGYAVSSINYRLSTEAKFPAQIHDVKASVRWLRAHAAHYNLDADRIGALGESAGGHLVSLLGTANDIPELEGRELGYPEFSSRVQAVVDLFGPVDFLPAGKLSGDALSRMETELLGTPLWKRPDLVKQANPTTYITSDDPPFLIMHGTRDQLVPPQQSRDFHAALLPVLGEQNVTSHFFQAGHTGLPVLHPSNLARIIDFFDKHLKAAA
jgi:acetyl esterase/lipase